MTASDEVTVFAVSKSPGFTDGYLALPTNVLGYEYYVMTYKYYGHYSPKGPAQIGIIGE